MISAHDEATSESITPRVEIDGEVYPLRLWTKMKKRSVDTAALKTDMYTCTSGTIERTRSLCVCGISMKITCREYSLRQRNVGKS
jgi:hypothetical protein